MPPRIEQLDRNFSYEDSVERMRWYDARRLPLEGLGWSDVEHWSDRLPARAKQQVGEALWHLCQHSAGVCIRFSTVSARVAAHWVLRSDQLAMPHMPATGVSGVDLYVREAGTWRWVGAAKGNIAVDTRQTLLNASPVMREYMLYFPLYNGVQEFEVGVDAESTMTAPPPRAISHKPIVFFGTSIVQGGCASRPGMAYPAILGRRLDCPVINLGFSGNGSMRPEISTYVAELDPSIFVIDSLPNMTPELIAQNTEGFVSDLRKRRAETPIVLVENIIYQTTLADSTAAAHVPKNKALCAAYERLLKAGVTHLHYVPAAGLIGDDWESTVDGTHLTDLGFLRMARALEPLLKSFLHA